jgi:hypothetical protein
MIYTHVLNDGVRGVDSSTDKLCVRRSAFLSGDRQIGSADTGSGRACPSRESAGIWVGKLARQPDRDILTDKNPALIGRSI